jgi:xanthine dehydrogenase YagR molybdenum-binding subunit
VLSPTIVRLNRFLGAYDAGRILNPKTARNQAIGGIIWGVGQALLEQSETDPTLARAKGLGELTAVSVAPAIANAIYHATGRKAAKFLDVGDAQSDRGIPLLRAARLLV